MRLHFRVLFNIFILYGIILTGLFFFASCSRNNNNKNITASGIIEAREINIASKVSGQVTEIRVEEGNRVKAGDVLVKLDHDSLDIQLRQVEAGEILAKSQLDLLRNGARAEDIQQAEDAVRQAEANLKIAEDDVKRMRELLAKGSVAVKQKEDAEARFTVALAQQSTAKQVLMKIQRLARPEELKAAQARLDQAIASVDLLRKTISDCTITAPVAGIVTHKPFEEGELITPGSTVLTISELDRVHLIIYVTEKELGKVKIGQTADVTIDSAQGRTFTGKVIYISPEAEFTPKNIQTKEDRVKLVFSVKIEINNSDGILKPGLPADARIQVEEIKQ